MKNYTVQSFTEDDLKFHRKQVLKLWLHLLVAILVLGGLFGIFFAAIPEFREHYEMALAPFCIPIIYFVGITIYRFVVLLHDRNEGKKIVGDFPAELKMSSGSRSTNYYLIIPGSRERYFVAIPRSIHDQILPGERISIEFSMHAKVVFRLSKTGRQFKL